MPDTITYRDGVKEIELTLSSLVGECLDCGETYTGEAAEYTRHNAVCAYLGLLESDEIYHIRESYGKSRDDFAQITGIGAASLSRWETAQSIQSSGYDNFLRLLKDPANFAALAERNKGNQIDEARMKEIRKAASSFTPKFQILTPETLTTHPTSEQIFLRQN